MKPEKIDRQWYFIEKIKKELNEKKCLKIYQMPCRVFLTFLHSNTEYECVSLVKKKLLLNLDLH